ncbi:MAG: EAL domain-containing protein [Candidatus Thiodiazotropha taylori]|nr:EAL domain-containing protein [Candidatus Thiodiazotropha taylori]
MPKKHNIDSAWSGELLEQLEMGVAVYQPVDDGRDFLFVDINPHVEKNESVSRSDLAGRLLTEVFPGVEEFGLLDVMRRVWKTGKTEELPATEYRDARIHGWRVNRVYRISNGYVVAVYEDVTERINMQQALQASEGRYRHLTESSLDGIWEWDLQADTLYLSPRWKAQLGYQDDELPNEFETWSNRLHPADSARVMKHLDSYLKHPQPIWQEEFRLRHKNGSYIWLLARGSAVFNEQQEVTRILGVHIDINQLKLEQQLRLTNENRLAAMLSLNQGAHRSTEKEIIQIALEHAVSLTVSEVGYLHFVNNDQESIELVTWSKQTLKHCNAAFDSHYPLSMAGVWADCVRTKKPQIHNDYPNLDDKKGLPEGHIPLKRHMSLPVIDKGQVKLVIGVGNKLEEYTTQDVQQLKYLVSDLWQLIEKKRTDEKLKQAAAVYESTQEAVTITDPSPKIVAVNRAFTEITGYQESEVLGKNPSVLKSGRHDELFYESMWRELTSTGRWQGEIWNRRKSGEVYPEWLNISAVLDEGGLISHYVAVFSDISLLKQSESQLERMAHYDPLTGLPNRILLFSRIEHAIQRAKRSGHPLAVLFLDLDNFKNVNDSLGHPTGDRLLKVLAERIQLRLRSEDTVARIGGDEFVILIENMAYETDLAELAEVIIKEVTKPAKLDNHELSVGGSIGISIYPENGKTVTDLIKNADAAMYLAKERGRNSYQFYTPQLTTKAKKRLRVESELRQAIKQGEIEAFYQPVVRISDEKIVGAEALARWHRKGSEYVMPGVFIPIAEDSGLIEQITEVILEQVCQNLADWNGSLGGAFKVAINMSARQFESVNLEDEISSYLKRFELTGDRLELELTERVLMHDAEKTAAKLRRLRSLGATISIDDFGTGFSSLSYLTRFPIDKLKIDRSFISQVCEQEDKQVIVSTIIAMAKNLSMTVTAEGVETATQLMLLRNHACDYYQGYFYSRPVSAGDFTALLKNSDHT